VQVRKVTDIVDKHRATVTTLLAFGTKHEVIDDPLTADLEQVGEGSLSGRRIKDVLFLDFDPRQPAPLGTQAVTQTGEFFFFGQMLLASGQPLGLRDDFRVMAGPSLV
jgi:hypothetical protein